MRLSKVVVVALAVASSALFAHAQVPGNAWNFPDFSATQVLQFQTYEMPMKVYRAGSNVRVDQTAAINKLYLTAKGKAYDLTTYPDGSHQCVVMTLAKAHGIPSPLQFLFNPVMKRNPAGTAVVEGHHCKIEIVVVKGPDGTSIESKVWEAEDLKGIPVKIETYLPAGKFTAVYRDIKLGTPDLARFTAPLKCTPLEKMGQVVEHKIIK